MSEVSDQPAQGTPSAGESKQAADVNGQSTQAQDVAAQAKPNEGEGAKPTAESKEAQKVVPEKYDLKLPDNSHLTPAYIEKIASYAKDRGLSNEEAQQMLERENSVVSEVLSQKEAEFRARTEEWKELAKADKEIGGEGFAKSTELAKRVIQKFASDELKDELNRTGFGNHPELIRVFTRIGKLMSEDQLVMPGTQAGGKKSLEDIFYPTQTN